jgi:hypothetical protein
MIAFEEGVSAAQAGTSIYPDVSIFARENLVQNLRAICSAVIGQRPLCHAKSSLRDRMSLLARGKAFPDSEARLDRTRGAYYA